MGRKKRLKLAHLCLFGASCLKFLAKVFVPGIMVEALCLPGWFLVDECMIKNTSITNETMGNGVEWGIYGMPDDWVNDKNRYIQLLKKDKVTFTVLMHTLAISAIKCIHRKLHLKG